MIFLIIFKIIKIILRLEYYFDNLEKSDKIKYLNYGYMIAVDQNNIPIVKFYINRSVDISCNNCRAFKICKDKNYREMQKILNWNKYHPLNIIKIKITVKCKKS